MSEEVKKLKVGEKMVISTKTFSPHIVQITFST